LREMMKYRRTPLYLEHAVGPVEARDVRRAIQEGRHETWVVTTRPDGSRAIQILDADGRVMPPSNSRILPLK